MSHAKVKFILINNVNGEFHLEQGLEVIDRQPFAHVQYINIYFSFHDMMI